MLPPTHTHTLPTRHSTGVSCPWTNPHERSQGEQTTLFTRYVGNAMNDAVLVGTDGDQAQPSLEREEENISKHEGPMAVGQNSTVVPSTMSDAISRDKGTLAHRCCPALLRQASRLAKTHCAIHTADGWIPKSTLYFNGERALAYSYKIYRLGHEEVPAWYPRHSDSSGRVLLQDMQDCDLQEDTKAGCFSNMAILQTTTWQPCWSA